MQIRLKRAYDMPEKKDGRRVLVDRIWPRGIRKEKAQLDEWLRDIAPSSKLRKWFNHDPKKWEGFVSRYFKELDENVSEVEKLMTMAAGGSLTLVYGAGDEEHNNGVALKMYLQKKFDKQGRGS